MNNIKWKKKRTCPNCKSENIEFTNYSQLLGESVGDGLFACCDCDTYFEMKYKEITLFDVNNTNIITDVMHLLHKNGKE